MIYDSCFWKEKLAIIARDINRQVYCNENECNYNGLEYDVFVSAFIVRKLIDSLKMTDKFSNSDIRCKKYKKKAKRTTFINNHKINELFELTKPLKTTCKVRDLSNYLIHSYCFVFSVDEANENIDGFFVSSDSDKN